MAGKNDVFVFHVFLPFAGVNSITNFLKAVRFQICCFENADFLLCHIVISHGVERFLI